MMTLPCRWFEGMKGLSRTWAYQWPATRAQPKGFEHLRSVTCGRCPAGDVAGGFVYCTPSEKVLLRVRVWGLEPKRDFFPGGPQARAANFLAAQMVEMGLWALVDRKERLPDPLRTYCCQYWCGWRSCSHGCQIDYFLK